MWFDPVIVVFFAGWIWGYLVLAGIGWWFSRRQKGRQ